MSVQKPDFEKTLKHTSVVHCSVQPDECHLFDKVCVCMITRLPVPFFPSILVHWFFFLHLFTVPLSNRAGGLFCILSTYHKTLILRKFHHLHLCNIKGALLNQKRKIFIE